MTSRRLSRLCALPALLAIFAGCAATSPVDHPRPPSSALDDYASTTLGRQHLSLEKAHPGQSGFTLLRRGNTAFNARVATIDLAEKTIDLQVYIWEPDETGRILAERLLRAADRGVRVRLLVDDLGFGGSDAALVAMDSHPNIELRVFNPFRDRGSGLKDFLTDFKRVNRRMHNKITIVDNSFAIVGGRNIGDHYFAVNPETNFRDLDIAAVGPVVREVSRVFDHFWAGRWSVPAAAVVDADTPRIDLHTFAQRVRDEIATGHYPYSVDDDVVRLQSEMAALEERYIWAPGQIIWDDPGRTGPAGETGGEIVAGLRQKIVGVQHSLDIESAYFVVGDGGVESTRGLIERGVEVNIFTNSLASNDVLAAHAGHAEFREDLLRAGANIWEMRPDSTVIKKTWVGESRAGLHTKALAFDGDSVFIGSFNLDPRSANLNTEAGIYVESEELARQLLEYMAEGRLPENAYRVTLDEDGDLVWTTVVNGEEQRYDRDPLSTFGQRFLSGFIELLPVESQL